MPKIVDHARMRVDIVEAAVRVIARIGPQRVTIRSIAAEAGISPAAPLHYFDSRDSLCEFAFQHISQQSVAELERIAIDESLKPIERLHAIINAIFERSSGDLFFTRLLLGMVIAGHDNEVIKAVDAQTYRRTQLLIENAITAAKAAAELDPSIDSATETLLILTLADGLVVTATTMGEQADHAKQELLSLVLARLSQHQRRPAI